MNRNFKKSTMAAAIFIAFSASSAQASIIKADVSGSVEGVTFTDIAGPATSGSVDVLASQYGANSDVFYHTYGDVSGNFGSRVSGYGEYDLTGIFSYKDTITNNSGAAQAYNFDFTVVAGELALYGAPMAGEETHAEYNLDILVNGSSVWNSNAALDNVGGTTIFAQSGTSLGGTVSSNTYYWNDFLSSIDLGIYDNNESFEFEYVLASHAAGNCFTATPYTSTPNQEPPADQELFMDDVNGGEGGEQCGSTARIGDPFFFGGANSGNITTSSVPAPGGLALLGLGLAGVAATRRRKNKAK